jgi:predicted dehydrogenase
MSPVRLGIVGAGWGANHARVAASLAPDVEVRAICSRRHERAQALADELALPPGSIEAAWEALVARDDVDLVVNTAPDYLHHPVTLAAITRGKHVFCEKPLAMNAAQAREMLEAAETAGVAHFTGFTWRFAPPFATIRRLLDADALGSVWLIDSHFRIGPPLPSKEWQFDPELRAGGVVGNLGVHLIDLARYLAQARGGTVADRASIDGWRIWAKCELGPEQERASRERPAGKQGSDVNNVAWLHLEMGSVRARLQVSQLPALRAVDPVRVEVHGERQTAVGYANPLFPQTQRVELIERISFEAQRVEPLDFPGGPPAVPTAALPSGGLLQPTIRHLYAAHIVPRLTGGVPAAGTPTFYDGWIAQRLMDAALRSSDTGMWQTV